MWQGELRRIIDFVALPGNVKSFGILHRDFAVVESTITKCYSYSSFCSVIRFTSRILYERELDTRVWDGEQLKRNDTRLHERVIITSKRKALDSSDKRS